MFPPLVRAGICTLDQLTSERRQDLRKRDRPVAITLYPAVAAGDLPDRDLLLELILMEFTDAHGAYKRTQSHRFDLFDQEAASLLRQRMKPGRRFVIHDMGVSDGRTAVDFFQLLAGLGGCDLLFVATDHACDVKAISQRGGSVVAVVDPHSLTPLQVVKYPFVFNVQKRESGWHYPVNRILLALLLRTTVRWLLARFRAGHAGVLASDIRLLSPECLRLLEDDRRFSFRQHNVLDPPFDRFDAVRAMNVLNRSYFQADELQRAVRQVHASLSDGGLFITGSNQDAGSPVDGAVYVRTAGGFSRLVKSGNGSQIDSIIADLIL